MCSNGYLTPVGRCLLFRDIQIASVYNVWLTEEFAFEALCHVATIIRIRCIFCMTILSNTNTLFGLLFGPNKIRKFGTALLKRSVVVVRDHDTVQPVLTWLQKYSLSLTYLLTYLLTLTTAPSYLLFSSRH